MKTMKNNIHLQNSLLCISCALLLSALQLSAAPLLRLPLDKTTDGTVISAGKKHQGSVHGNLKQVSGAVGRALLFDGSSLATLPSAADMSIGNGPFSFTAWVNPHMLEVGQQMVVAKNNYAAGQREWSLMIDKNDRFCFYVWNGGWQTIAATTRPKVGHWHHVAVTIQNGIGRIYVNGKQEGKASIPKPVKATAAPLSIGGAKNGGSHMQQFNGAIDEVTLFREALSAETIAKQADRKTVPHKGIQEAAKLWGGDPLPKSADIPVLPNVEFHVIKPHQPKVDGGNWILGTALCWHKGRLYSSFGFNAGHENTPTEEARVRISDDNGKTWGRMVVVDPGEGNLGVSHGVFLSHKGVLWSFNGAFYDRFQRTHTRAYTLNEASGAWEKKGIVVDDGFWPMQEPLKMSDGNWIMAGARFPKGYDGKKGNLPAVAISHGDDFTKWDLVVIPSKANKIWGESTVFISGKRIINISRWGGQAKALMAVSEDCGRTWTPSLPSNLNMATSKPYAGTLSNGRNYLICTTTADSGGGRAPLTIAVSRPGEETFSSVFVIRHALNPAGPGPSAANLDLSYPYAVEKDGKLYVGYAIKSHKTAEMAVVPISELKEPEPIKLWTGSPVPKTAAIPVLKDVEFSVIKPCEFQKDGYRFLHGVALGWHKGRLYASIGHNQGGENTDTEEARVCYSDDDGMTWSKLVTIDGQREPGVGVSHGVFLSHKGRFWAFHGAYHGTMEKVHTRAYLLNEKDGSWERKGTVIGGGFWPMQEPIKMDDGNWIMGGLKVGNGNPAAVAISHGDDLMKWDLVVIPNHRTTGKMWGESTVLVDGKKITNISRYGKDAKALAAFSEDYGRTWTKMRVSNLPMATSKPYTDTLSTGQRYLICSTTADGGGRRSPLTIALSRPGEETFSKVYVIRHAVFPDGPGESHPRSALSYPYAVEHDGKLYVGYSNSGGGVGRVGKGRELWNNNSAEMAIIPLDSL